MRKYCVFPTFLECKEAQNYDHLYMKAVSFAAVTGLDLSVIKENSLHIQNENGFDTLDNYIADNNIEIENPELYTQVKKYWIVTTGWSLFYKYNDQFVYLKDHSDRNYNLIEIDEADLIPLDSNGEILPTAAIPFNPYVPDEAVNG